jgi:hypothetical protein
MIAIGSGQEMGAVAAAASVIGGVGDDGNIDAAGVGFACCPVPLPPIITTQKPEQAKKSITSFISGTSETGAAPAVLGV